MNTFTLTDLVAIAVAEFILGTFAGICIERLLG